jgi:peptidoglycan/xylan/chitin deacetylase (PgdA/CDA1 family)
MTRRRIGRLQRAVRRLRSGLGQQVLILLYHRVAKLDPDPWSLAVTPHHFAEHLEVMRQRTRPIPLQQLARALSYGNLPNRSVVVTFDDGYADNFHDAKPLLERYDVPATVFVSSGFIGHRCEIWWDELDHLLLQPGMLPEKLRLKVNRNTYQWKLGEVAQYSERTQRRHRRWRAWEEAPSSRHALYCSLWELLHTATEEERRRVLSELRDWADAEPAKRLTHRPLSLKEVVGLARGGLVEIGAHTVTHPVLSVLSLTSQRREILESKNRLQAILGRPVTSFAYPYGRHSDYSAKTLTIVQQAGFTTSCCSFSGLVKRSTDPHQLPRVQVHDWDGDEFDRELSQWLGI